MDEVRTSRLERHLVGLLYRLGQVPAGLQPCPTKYRHWAPQQAQAQAQSQPWLPRSPWRQVQAQARLARSPRQQQRPSRAAESPATSDQQLVAAVASGGSHEVRQQGQQMEQQGQQPLSPSSSSSCDPGSSSSTGAGSPILPGSSSSNSSTGAGSPILPGSSSSNSSSGSSSLGAVPPAPSSGLVALKRPEQPVPRQQQEQQLPQAWGQPPLSGRQQQLQLQTPLLPQQLLHPPPQQLQQPRPPARLLLHPPPSPPQ